MPMFFVFSSRLLYCTLYCTRAYFYRSVLHNPLPLLLIITQATVVKRNLD